MLGEAIESGYDTVLTCGTLQPNIYLSSSSCSSTEVGLQSYLFVNMDEVVRKNGCHKYVYAAHALCVLCCPDNLLLDHLCGPTLVAIPDLATKEVRWWHLSKGID